MLAYFTGSLAGRKYHLAKYKKIVEILEGRNIEVIAEHILAANERKISQETRDERLKFHRELEGWIRNCDFMIAETSFPSISVGYEISLALQNAKPVLVLYSEGDPPSLIAAHENERLVCERYTLETLESVILDFILYAKGSNDTRFTFFLTSHLSGYLEKAAKKARLPKSVYLRQLLEVDMKSKK